MRNPQFRLDFLNILNKRPNAFNLFNELEKNGELILFGGSVRHYLDQGYSQIPRDFDLVLKSNYLSDFALEFFLNRHNCTYRKNKFNGYKVQVDDLVIDIWNIFNTWAIQRKKVSYQQIEDLNKTVFLNIDAICYNLTTEILYDDGYRSALENEELDIVLPDNPFIELNMTRAIYLKNKYNLNFSQKLRKYFHEWTLQNKIDEQEIIETVNKINNKRYLDKALTDKNIRDDIRSFILI